MSSCLPAEPAEGLDESAERGLGAAEAAGAPGADALASGADGGLITGVDGIDASVEGAAVAFGAGAGGGRSAFVSGAITGTLTETEPFGALTGVPAGRDVTG